MWFLYALIATLGWGVADMFYKKSSDEQDEHSHLKISVWVGLVMGICALLLLPLAETDFSVSSLFMGAVKYSPASFAYIISMVIGYAGLRYLELSIVSPVQNASGALSAIAIVVYYMIIGNFASVKDEFSILDIVGTAVIVIGVVALAIVEQRLSASAPAASDKKYRLSALALIFPILYCVFDTIGTAADGVILDESTGLGFGEMDVIILYGLTFFAVGLGCWIYLLIRTKKPYNPFTAGEIKTKGVAALCEEFGQVFYVYAMAAKPMLAAPMIGSYCIVSIILSRIFLKEKLKISQYICVLAVVVGIVFLGVSEGLAG